MATRSKTPHKHVVHNIDPLVPRGVVYRRNRLDAANKLLYWFATHDRRYFYSSASSQWAQLRLFDDRLYYVNESTGEHIRLTARHVLAGFHHGSTCRFAIDALRRYVMSGKKIAFCSRWIRLLVSEDHLSEVEKEGKDLGVFC